MSYIRFTPKKQEAQLAKLDKKPEFPDRVKGKKVFSHSSDKLDKRKVLYQPKTVAKLQKQNKVLLAFTIILSPLVIPAIITLVKYLSNRVKINDGKTHRLEGLNEILDSNLIITSDKDYEMGLHQLQKDLNREVKIDGHNIPSMIQGLIGDSKFKKDIPALKLELSEKLKTAKGIDHVVISSLHSFLEANANIEKLNTEDNLVTQIGGEVSQLILKGKNTAQILGLLLPNTSPKDRHNLAKFYSQSTMYLAKYLLNANASGYIAQLDNRTQNIFQAEDGSLRMSVTFNEIGMKSMEDGKIPILENASFEIEFVLTDDGFKLDQVKLSDHKMKDLVFAVTNEERTKAFSAYGLNFVAEQF